MSQTEDDVPELTPERIREALRRGAKKADENHAQRERDHLAGLNRIRWHEPLR